MVWKSNTKCEWKRPDSSKLGMTFEARKADVVVYQWSVKSISRCPSSLEKIYVGCLCSFKKYQQRPQPQK